MIKKMNTEIKAAISRIIYEDILALKNIFKNLAKIPPKTGLYIRKRARGKK